MTGPRRLLDEGASELERTLLESAAADVPSERGRRAAAVALGLSVAVAAVGTAAQATGSAAQATGGAAQAAGSASVLGAGFGLKVLVLCALGAAAAAGVAVLAVVYGKAPDTAAALPKTEAALVPGAMQGAGGPETPARPAVLAGPAAAQPSTAAVGAEEVPGSIAGPAAAQPSTAAAGEVPGSLAGPAAVAAAAAGPAAVVPGAGGSGPGPAAAAAPGAGGTVPGPAAVVVPSAGVPGSGGRAAAVVPSAGGTGPGGPAAAVVPSAGGGAAGGPAAAAAPGVGGPGSGGPAAVVPGDPVTPAAPRGPSLADEVALLDSARTALSHGDPRSTLAVLTRHAREFPEPALAPEAAALRIEALLAQGDRELAATLAKTFYARYPNHPLETRLRSLLSIP